ncbi:hypothetical protein J6590_037428 [Homalodisca vitripennis]|nr:hypothetical protein J6590_037428 [Homalodisca vitripennis]
MKDEDDPDYLVMFASMKGQWRYRSGDGGFNIYPDLCVDDKSGSGPTRRVARIDFLMVFSLITGSNFRRKHRIQLGIGQCCVYT